MGKHILEPMLMIWGVITSRYGETIIIDSKPGDTTPTLKKGSKDTSTRPGASKYFAGDKYFRGGESPRAAVIVA